MLAHLIKTDNRVLGSNFEISLRRYDVKVFSYEIFMWEGPYCIFMKIEENTFNVIPQHRGIWYSEVSIHRPSVAAVATKKSLKLSGFFLESLKLSGLLSKNCLLCPHTDGGEETRRRGTSAVTLLLVLVIIVVVFPLLALVLVVRPVLHLLLVLLQLEHRVEECVASITTPVPFSCLSRELELIGCQKTKD